MKAEKVLTFLITTFVFGLLLDLSFLSASSHFLFPFHPFFLNPTLGTMTSSFSFSARHLLFMNPPSCALTKASSPRFSQYFSI